MMENITSKEVAQKFAAAIELLLDWIDQRMRKHDPRNQETSPSSTDQLLRVGEVAKILCVSRAHAYHMIEAKQIPSIRLGQALRVRIKDLQALIEKMAKD